MGQFLNRSMPGLDDPLRVLFSSHDRIRFHIGALKQLASELPLHGASARARATAGEVMRFFDSAAMQHHEGEERDLFPAMLAATPAKAAPQVHALIAVLEKEHRQLAAGWNSLREELARIAAGSMGNVDVEWVAAYECLYDGHIEREEVQLLPLAGMLLTKDQLLKVGAAMSLRRSSRR